MAELLEWDKRGDTLALRGELDRVTLLPLWEQREKLLEGVRLLDVSRLDRVDSAGVALMLHLCNAQAQSGGTLMLCGVTDRLRTLITLYNLHTILPYSDSPCA